MTKELIIDAPKGITGLVDYVKDIVGSSGSSFIEKVAELFVIRKKIGTTADSDKEEIEKRAQKAYVAAHRPFVHFILKPVAVGLAACALAYAAVSSWDLAWYLNWIIPAVAAGAGWHGMHSYIMNDFSTRVEEARDREDKKVDDAAAELRNDIGLKLTSMAKDLGHQNSETRFLFNRISEIANDTELAALTKEHLQAPTGRLIRMNNVPASGSNAATAA